MRVIEWLEVVQIQRHQRTATRVARAGHQGLRQSILNASTQAIGLHSSFGIVDYFVHNSHYGVME
jgi:hypothetical protein